MSALGRRSEARAAFDRASATILEEGTRIPESLVVTYALTDIGRMSYLARRELEPARLILAR